VTSDDERKIIIFISKKFREECFRRHSRYAYSPWLASLSNSIQYNGSESRKTASSVIAG
jgi:hypothetical protein